MPQVLDSFERLIATSPRSAALGFAAVGVMLTTSFAPFGLRFLAPAAVLPVLMSALLFTPRQSARCGFFFGLGMFGSGTYWIYVSVHVFGQAPLWIALLLMASLVLIMSMYCALIAGCASALSARSPWRLVVVGPAVWVVVEWLRGWLFSGFPWLSLGYGQIDSPLSGWAPVLGVYGVSLMLLVSVVAVVPLLAGASARWAAVLLLISPWVAGSALQLVEWTEPTGEPRITTLVQGGVPQDRKWQREQFAPTLNLYRDALLAARESHLVVWPEVAIPAVMSSVPAYLEQLQRDVAASSKTLALGILEPHANGTQVYNSVLLLDGRREQTYRKRHLVPFGEYFPVPDFVREWMRLLSLPNTDMQAGAAEQPVLVAADGTRLAAAICYEDAYGAEQLMGLPEAEILINVSNDAWFGDSIAPHQHLEVARMRALEVGRWIARATNTGISAFIGPDGSLHAVAPQFEFATLTAALEPRSGATPYVRTGNTPLITFLAAILAARLLLMLRAKRLHSID